MPFECSLLLESMGGCREGPRGVEGCLNSRPMGGHQPGSHRVQPAKDVVLLRGESGVSDGPGGCSQAAASPKCRLLSGGHVAWTGHHWDSAALSLGFGDSPEPMGAVVGDTYARVSSIHLREVSFSSCCLLLLLLSHFSHV